MRLHDEKTRLFERGKRTSRGRLSDEERQELVESLTEEGSIEREDCPDFAKYSNRERQLLKEAAEKDE